MVFWKNLLLYFLKSNHLNIEQRFSHSVYLNDINTPVGLDLSRLFDAIVDKDKNGNYYIVENLDIEKQEEMINAVEMFIQLLRANPKFKEHFSNSLVSELE